MLKQRLQQKLLQKLSPQQIQLIKLLEIPTMQLEQRIKAEIEENPVLEEGSELSDDYDDAPPEKEDKGFSIDEYSQTDDIPSYKLNAQNFSKESSLKPDIPFTVGATFQDNLETQLGMHDLDEKMEELARYLIGNLDDDGYLRRDLEAIVDDLDFNLSIKTNSEELLTALKVIHELEPAGVGARDLQECLIIQISAKNQSNPIVALTKRILSKYFEEFSKKHFKKIMERLDISEDDMRDVVDEVLKLNPKPGGSYSDPHSKVLEHIIPDFILESVDDEFQLSLNSRNIPELRISNTYNDMLQQFPQEKGKATQQQKDALTFVKQKLDSAKWFIDAIKQRHNTLYSTMEAIIEFQEEYFKEGDESKLRPMILKDIADTTGLDISTISRVVNSKYIQTHFGIFSLKSFFSEGMQTESGEEVSTREIKRYMMECIDEESKQNPLTDDQLVEILQDKGYNIARRTVAKYREQLNIPVARLRKQI
jgi:RNA polymerase sigma-54 factor